MFLFIVVYFDPSFYHCFRYMMNGKLLKDLDIKYKDIFTHSLFTFPHHTHGYNLSLITVRRPQNKEKYCKTAI
jgi:hypothetical protein